MSDHLVLNVEFCISTDSREALLPTRRIGNDEYPRFERRKAFTSKN